MKNYVAETQALIGRAVENGSVIKIHPLDMLELMIASLDTVDIIQCSVVNEHLMGEYTVIGDKVYYQTVAAPRLV